MGYEKKSLPPLQARVFAEIAFIQNRSFAVFPPCQRQRRTEYHRRKIATDPAYRELCANSRTYWKEKNPEYPKQHRAKPKNGAATDKNDSALEELHRLLGDVKNTSARNTSPLTVTRCLIEVLWVAGAGASVATNSLAKAKVIIFQGDLRNAG